MIREAIVLAGGFGTRLSEVIKDVPKSMALINEKPFLEYQLNYLIRFGITKVIMSVGYKSEIIREFFKSRYKSLEIAYSFEDAPLGTGGGIKKAMSLMNGQNLFALNGDTLFEVNLQKMYQFHISKNADITLALRRVENVSRYGTVDIDNNSRITGFAEKSSKSGRGLINGGIYILNKDLYLNSDLPEKFSVEKDFFEKYYKEEMIFGFPCEDYFLDIGIPSDFTKAQDEFKRFKD